MKTRTLLIVCMCISTSTFAGGYRVALQGQNATGMGHTGVAVTDSAEVVFFNPAGMTFLSKAINIGSGVSLIDSVTRYQNTTSNTAAETDNPIGSPLYLYYSQKYNENFSYGFGLYTPYGNSVEWKKDWPGSHLVNNISLTTIFFQPTVSFRINDKLSVGLGPYLANGSVEFNRNLNTSLVDADGNRSNVTVKASNVNSWGYNVGVLARPTKSLSFGISYRSQVDLKANGESANFENVPSSLQTTYPDSTFDAELVLPAELTLGISFAPGTNTLLAFDINRTYWSAYKNLDIHFENGVGTALNPRNYKDANIYRFGIQHIVRNTLTIRGGAYYDTSPISAGYYTPETARNDSIGLTAGAGYQISKSLDVDFSFLYLMFDEFNGSYDYYDQSGTTVSFGGDYKSSVTSVGLGLNYKY